MLFKAANRIQKSTQISLSGNERIADMFQKAGVDVDRETGWVPNLARGKAVTASFSTTTPDMRAAAPDNAVDGYTISGLPIQQATYLARNTIWGTQGSPNAQDWLEVDLGAPSTFDTVKLYFFSDKTYMTQSNGSGNTYRPTSAYAVQVHNGTDWVDVARNQAAPMPNLNTVTFSPVTAQRVRVLVSNQAGFGTGIKEFQVFKAASCDTVIDRTRVGRLAVTSGITCLTEDATIIGPVSVSAGAGLISNGATINGPVSASGARTFQLLGGRVVGPVTVDRAFGRVALSGALIVGPVRLSGNTTGETSIDVMANTIAGPLACHANEPAPVDNGLPNTVIGPVTCRFE